MIRKIVKILWHVLIGVNKVGEVQGGVFRIDGQQVDADA
jgi:hypothetical protein